MENLLEEVHIQYVNAEYRINIPTYRKELSSETLLKGLHYMVFLDEEPIIMRNSIS